MQSTHINPHGTRRAWRMDAKCRSRFHEVGPVLSLHVEDEVLAPEGLRGHARQRRGVAEAALGVVDEIFIEVADVDAVPRGFKKPAATFAPERRAVGASV